MRVVVFASPRASSGEEGSDAGRWSACTCPNVMAAGRGSGYCSGSAVSTGAMMPATAAAPPLRVEAVGSPGDTPPVGALAGYRCACEPTTCPIMKLFMLDQLIEW